MKEAIRTTSEAEIGQTVQFDVHELGNIAVSVQNR